MKTATKSAPKKAATAHKPTPKATANNGAKKPALDEQRKDEQDLVNLTKDSAIGGIQPSKIKPNNQGVELTPRQEREQDEDLYDIIKKDILAVPVDAPQKEVWVKEELSQNLENRFREEGFLVFRTEENPGFKTRLSWH